jgi:peptidoglycan/xylan/chitin deacetylase (PgdA/CDA1 family)
MRDSTRPALLVGIDTESDNQWDLEARRRPTFENLYALGRLHAFFQRHHVRPTYVITHPVARDPRSAEVLRGLLAEGDCEVGAHHHVWETPPCDPADLVRHPYALSLPLDRFDAQLASLTSAIADAVGRRPVSYRSGRFGFSAAHVSSLEQQGYLVESSVAPLFYEAHKRGPDFVGAPLAPYFLAYDDATRPGSSNLLELPVSAALDRRLPAWLARWYARAPWPYQTKRALRLLRIARTRWLRPSYSSAEDMMALARQITRRGLPLLNLLFHSSEAIAGASPYNRTAADLDAFFDRLSRVLSFAMRDLGAEALTFAEFRQRFCARLSRLAPPAA